MYTKLKSNKNVTQHPPPPFSKPQPPTPSPQYTTTTRLKMHFPTTILALTLSLATTTIANALRGTPIEARQDDLAERKTDPARSINREGRKASV